MKTRSQLMSFLAVFTCVAAFSSRADWPQYHGPNLNNQTSEKLSVKWPATGLREVWRRDFNTGFSSFTVAGDRAYTLVRRERDGLDWEMLLAVNADSGEELWSYPLCMAKYAGGGDSGARNNSGGDGPRSTPSIDGDRIYAYSSQMNLVCLNAKDGSEIWRVDVLRDFNGKSIHWENAASPLVDGNKVFIFGGGPGEALLAFDKTTGELAWKLEDDRMTHSTPTAATISGTRQVIFFTEKGLVGIEANTGKRLWRQDYPYRTSRGISPVVSEDLVYVSQAYGVGGGVYRVANRDGSWTTEEVWRTPNKNMNHWSMPVIHDGYIYGIFGHNKHAEAPLQCVDLKTGEVVWEKEGFGMGNVILAGGRLLALTDYGEVVLVEASPEKYTELARTKVLSGKCWSTPAVSGGRLYVRSTTEGACFDISPAKLQAQAGDR